MKKMKFAVSLHFAGGNEVSKYQEPSGEGVRVDAALYAGGKPSMHYARWGMFSAQTQGMLSRLQHRPTTRRRRWWWRCGDVVMMVAVTVVMMMMMVVALAAVVVAVVVMWRWW